MLELYHYDRSTAAQKIQIALAENARPSFEAGVKRWGDDTSKECAKFAAEAFPTLKSLWEAAG